MEGLCQGFVRVSETKLDILRVSVNADVLLLWVEVESNPSVRLSALSCPHQPTVQWCLLLACSRTPSSPLSSPCMKVVWKHGYRKYHAELMDAGLLSASRPSNAGVWKKEYGRRSMELEYGRRFEMEKV